MTLSYRLVVARYREDLEWVDAFDRYTIYNKGRDDLSSKHRKNSIRLKNLGREGHSYINHVINNYDNLEDIIIFSQGNYVDHIPCEPDEFLERMIEDIDQVGFSTKLRRRGPVGSNHRNFTLHEYRGPLKSKIPYDLGGWWELTTGEAYVRSKSVFWNSFFAVRKDFILKRSIEGYKNILSTLDWSENPMEAHFCERTWFNIFNLPLSYVIEDYKAPEKENLFDIERLIAKHKVSSRPKVRLLSKDKKHKQDPMLSREQVLGVLDNIGDLMNKDEETVRECVEALKFNVLSWADRDNACRFSQDQFVNKMDLEDKANWYSKFFGYESMEVSTTGSTTGYPFKYMRWMPAFEKIEWDYHYNFVLDEFEIPKDFHLLYFFSSYYKIDGEKMISCFNGPSDLSMNNHGTDRTPVVHYANYNSYSADPDKFFKYFFEYVEKNKIDVLFTAPPQTNSLCSYIRKYRFQGKIATLLSSTNERMLQQDAHFLFENNHFDHICDHMRCWDGGGSFFTCKYRNYHLMDNLAWCEQGPNNEFICTDYFNLASPFVRYWNGDYCKIDNEYKRCECGRLYREFEFLENRPFSLKGVCFKEIKEKITELGIEGIKQVRCSPETLDVISSKPLNEEEMQSISMLTDKFQFRFKVEAD